MSDVSISAQTSAEQRAHEPSMEEILASIRRIIADDQVLPLSRAATPSAPPAPAAQVAAAPREAPAAPAISAPRPAFPRATGPALRAPPGSDRQVQAPRPADEPQPAERVAVLPPVPTPVRNEADLPPPAAAFAPERPIRPSGSAVRDQAPIAPPAPSEADDASLLSAGANASISSSFNALATTVLLQNSGMIEDSIREMLRPLLKQWLDDNLPVIVERLVRQEIERVARGRR